MDIKKTAARLAMARGTIVLDENVQSLQTPLRKKNIRVLCPKPGTSDPEIVETLLANRILVTNNSKDFIRDASSYDFGIIARPVNKQKNLLYVAGSPINLEDEFLVAEIMDE